MGAIKRASMPPGHRFYKSLDLYCSDQCHSSKRLSFSWCFDDCCGERERERAVKRRHKISLKCLFGLKSVKVSGDDFSNIFILIKPVTESSCPGGGVILGQATPIRIELIECHRIVVGHLQITFRIINYWNSNRLIILRIFRFNT